MPSRLLGHDDAQVRDLFGHKWSIATHQRDVGPDEMRQAMQTM